jgi:hypothetical protein
MFFLYAYHRRDPSVRVTPQRLLDPSHRQPSSANKSATAIGVTGIPEVAEGPAPLAQYNRAPPGAQVLDLQGLDDLLPLTMRVVLALDAQRNASGWVKSAHSDVARPVDGANLACWLSAADVTKTVHVWTCESGRFFYCLLSQVFLICMMGKNMDGWTDSYYTSFVFCGHTSTVHHLKVLHN